ncbi:MAG: threonylcarbamoyl-AMP synthase [Bacteroidetes bacterium]|nr:threonylcarbamoyl-AMP synthase [Bacteroidota bacterium]
MAETGKNIDHASDLLLNGGLVAIPTETVYGLAANALNEKAVLAVFEAKQRPFFDPLIIHVPDIESASKYATFQDERLKALAEKFWPGPLTLLLLKQESIPGLVTSGLAQVAVRVPDHELTLQLLRAVNVPLAAPSANPFGYVSPTTAMHVEKQLGDKIDYILDGGACKVGLESTIVGVEDNKLCVYRLGGLSLEELESVAGKLELRINSSGDPKAPGQLKSHYAPKKPLLLGKAEALIKNNSDKKLAVICFGNKSFENNITVFNLSPGKDLKEAALNLFKYLRAADDSQADLVIAELLPETGLGRAINDRLKRAAC